MLFLMVSCRSSVKADCQCGGNDVHYEKYVLKYEDILIAKDIVNKGGKTLKLQSWVYRASHCAKGGSELSRGQDVQTQVSDIIDAAEFARLPQPRKNSILGVVAWAQERERPSNNSNGHAAKRACIVGSF